MAAFAGSPLNSSLYARQVGTLKADAIEVEGALQSADFLYTHAAGAGTGEINLLQLPAGHIRVYPDLSRLVTSQTGTSSTIDIGHRAYVDWLGVTQVDDDNSLHDNGASGAGALDTALALPAAGFIDYNTRDGVVIYASIDSGDLEDADTIYLHLVYKRLR